MSCCFLIQEEILSLTEERGVTAESYSCSLETLQPLILYGHRSIILDFPYLLILFEVAVPHLIYTFRLG